MGHGSLSGDSPDHQDRGLDRLSQLWPIVTRGPPCGTSRFGSPHTGIPAGGSEAHEQRDRDSQGQEQAEPQ